VGVCEYCGGGFSAKRSDAKYCCPNHRQYARRQRLRTERAAKDQTMTFEGRELLDRLAVVLPSTARRVESFVLENGAGCTEAAVRLVLSAYSEVRAIAV
jgi:hypothetical protein